MDGSNKSNKIIFERNDLWKSKLTIFGSSDDLSLVRKYPLPLNCKIIYSDVAFETTVIVPYNEVGSKDSNRIAGRKPSTVFHEKMGVYHESYVIVDSMIVAYAPGEKIDIYLSLHAWCYGLNWKTYLSEHVNFFFLRYQYKFENRTKEQIVSVSELKPRDIIVSNDNVLCSLRLTIVTLDEKNKSSSKYRLRVWRSNETLVLFGSKEKLVSLALSLKTNKWQLDDIIDMSYEILSHPVYNSDLSEKLNKAKDQYFIYETSLVNRWGLTGNWIAPSIKLNLIDFLPSYFNGGWIIEDKDFTHVTLEWWLENKNDIMLASENLSISRLHKDSSKGIPLLDFIRYPDYHRIFNSTTYLRRINEKYHSYVPSRDIENKNKTYISLTSIPKYLIHIFNVYNEIYNKAIEYNHLIIAVDSIEDAEAILQCVFQLNIENIRCTYSLVEHEHPECPMQHPTNVKGVFRWKRTDIKFFKPMVEDRDKIRKVEAMSHLIMDILNRYYIFVFEPGNFKLDDEFFTTPLKYRILSYDSMRLTSVILFIIKWCWGYDQETLISKIYAFFDRENFNLIDNINSYLNESNVFVGKLSKPTKLNMIPNINSINLIDNIIDVNDEKINKNESFVNDSMKQIKIFDSLNENKIKYLFEYTLPDKTKLFNVNLYDPLFSIMISKYISFHNNGLINVNPKINYTDELSVVGNEKEYPIRYVYPKFRYIFASRHSYNNSIELFGFNTIKELTLLINISSRLFNKKMEKYIVYIRDQTGAYLNFYPN